AAAAGAALGLGGGVATSAGGKRLKFRSRRRLTTERVATPTAGQDEPKDDIPEDVPDIEEAVEEGGRRGRGKSAAKSAGDEDGGGVGGKVAMVVGGVIGLIALVVGALVWYKVAAEKARADEEQAQIERGFDKARSSIAKTKNVAIKFADEFDEFANEAIEDCKKPTEELRRILSARYTDSVIAMLRPPPSAELMAAIASTNTAKAAEAPADAKSAEVGNAAAPAPAPVAKSTSPAGMSPAAIEAAVRQAMPFKFRDPTDDEADSASPGHEKYKKEKEAARAKWEAEVKAKVAAASQQVSSAAPAAAAAAAAAGAPSQGKSSEVPGIVKDVNGLWDKAYSCQAGAIRIRKAVTELLGDIEEADKIVGDDRQTMDKFIDVANQIKDRFEVIKSSKDVETVQKARGFINDRGKKYVEQTVRRLREEAAQAEREAAAARAAAAEKQRQEELKRQHAEKIAREVEAAKAGFQKVIDNRNLHLLDWDGAKRMLRNIELDTSEGQLQLDLEMNKVEAMEFVHKVMVRNAKGFTFTRGKLRNHTVVECDDKEVTVLKKGATKKQKIDWVKFYRNIEMHTNLNELMNKFVRLGKENGNPKLNLKEWANGMMGIGLTMRIICADDPTAANYGEQTVKDALKLFPHFLKQAKEYFPDLDFSEVAEAAAAENV
ncbi:MAG: hypothetical protein IJI73_05005, partial [Kiritimatiellae bacterium]|nr:hypothetical protein [Kiritimatiellia bacterium]